MRNLDLVGDVRASKTYSAQVDAGSFGLPLLHVASAWTSAVYSGLLGLSCIYVLWKSVGATCITGDMLQI